MKIKYLILSVFACLQMSLNAQSLSYSNSYNLTSPTHIGDYGVPTQETQPTGMIFGDSGTKLYLVGSGTSGNYDHVVQYDLSSPYEVSTKGPVVGFFNTYSEETSLQDIMFNADGTKMYVLGGAGDDVVEYVVTVPWNVASINTAVNTPVIFNAEAAIDAYLSPTTSHGDNLSGFRFNANGTKLFIVDYSADQVFEFSLSTAYDIATSGDVVDAALDVSGEETQPRAIEFNSDGTKLYVLGRSGDDINTYNLATGYDLTSLTTKTVSSSLSETSPEALLINNDGTKFYIAGFDDDQIKHYTLSTGYDFSSTVTLITSTIFETIEPNPQGMVFNTDGTKFFVIGSTNDRVSEISLSTPYDISTGTLVGSLDFNGHETTPTGLAFDNTGDNLFIIGTEDDEINQYSLSTPFDLSSTTITHSGPFSVKLAVTGMEALPTDLYFNTDGSKLFVLGNTNNRVYQFSLVGHTYDLSTLTADYQGDYSALVDTAPYGIAFSSKGDKMYIAGLNGDDIEEFTLTNDFDITSGTISKTNTFDVATEEPAITDVVFSNDGSRFYIAGTGDDELNQYYTKVVFPETPNDGTIDDITTPFLITLTGDTFFASSGVFTDTEVTIDGVPEGLTAVLTLNSATEAQLSFTGKANSHLNSDEAAVNLSLTFTDAAFTTSNAVDVSLAVAYSNFLGFDYIECADNEIVYDGATWTGGNAAGVPDNSGTDLAKAIRVQGDILITADTNCDCLQVESGQTLTVADGIELTVANSLELEGDIRLLGSAQLVQTHTGVKNASGTGNLYKDVKGTLSNVFQSGYWTSPVTTDGVTYNISGVLKDGTTPLAATGTPPDITFVAGYDGDHTTNPIELSRYWLTTFVDAAAWTYIDETTEINPGEGFNKKSTGNGTGQNYTFVGRPNDGDYEYSITGGNYSLYGNPYASPIDADAFIADNSTSILGTLHFYQAGIDFSHITAEYTGGYATRAGGMGNPAAELGGVGAKTPGQYMSIGQAFFVEASGTGGAVTFKNAQRDFNSSTEFFSKSAVAKATTDFPIVRIGFEFALENDTYHRQVSVGLRGLTDGYENGYEAEMWDYKSTDMALKVNGKDLPYAITGIEDFDTSLKIPLQVKTDSDRDVTFKIDENLSLNTNIYLFDSLTEIYYNITSQEATISLISGTYNDRFFVTFDETVLGVQDYELSKITIVNKNSTLFVNSTDLLDQVVIYNILGQNVATINNELKEQEIKVSTSSFKTGVYIVKAKNAKGSFTKKIIIN